MERQDKKQRLLKAKIAVALHSEFDRVPTEEKLTAYSILRELCGKPSLGYITNARSRRRAASLPSSRCYEYRLRACIHLDQTLALQQDALKAAGCERIFTDTASGSRTDRLGLTEAIQFARSGDTLVVWRLDRLGRSLSHLIQTATDLKQRGINFRSLQEQLDTTTSGGNLVFHFFGALAEFERDLVRERTVAGLAAARARGRRGGRPRKLSLDKVGQLRTLAADRTNSVRGICRTLGISRATYYRARTGETDLTG
jgi:DNA invertase Pin-like site-specific DNA recombinase